MSARNVRVEETTDYDIFVKLLGNRHVDPKHVARFVTKLNKEGNLTDIFPIVVNERMEVIDGQHRLEALRQLGWPVHYEVKKGLTITTVEALNTGVKNWTWFDYAFSYSERGNENYTRFLNLWDHFNLPYTIIRYYASAGTAQGGTSSYSFKGGDMVMDNQKETFELLKKYKEVSEAASHNTHAFAQAIYDIMRLPEYDHKRMVDKMKKYGGELKHYKNKLDYMRAIEDIYNTYAKADDKIRLF